MFVLIYNSLQYLGRAADQSGQILSERLQRQAEVQTVLRVEVL